MPRGIRTSSRIYTPAGLLFIIRCFQSFFSSYRFMLWAIMLLVWIQPYGARAVDLTKQDFSYLYDPYSPVHIKHRIKQEDGTFHLYFYLELKNPLRPENEFRVDVLAQKNYKDKGEVKLNVEPVKEDSTRRLMLIAYQLKADSKYDLLVGRFLINNVYYYYDIPIHGGLQFPTTDVLPLKDNGWPYFDLFAKEKTHLKFDDDVYAFQYDDQFGIARPPMEAEGQVKSATIKIDTTYVTRRIVAKKENQLIYVQRDTTINAGTAILTVSPYFPKHRRIGELAKSLRYLCKEEEYNAIQSARDTKAAFDQFWLSVIPVKDRARAVLKRYYNHVRLANQYFTDYKEGWRTDRGMIYIIYGYPTHVTRTGEKEIWTYTIGGRKQNFNFAKIPNLFVQHHYALIRDKDLYKIWLNEVAKWRKGNM